MRYVFGYPCKGLKLFSTRINKTPPLGRPWYAAVFALALLIAAGCSFEPALKVPKEPVVKSYTAGARPQKIKAISGVGAAGTAQAFAYGAKVEARWWKLYNSKAVDALVLRAIKNSPTLTASEAVLREAHENLKSVEGIFFPQLGLSTAAQRERQSGAGFGGPTRTFSLYTGDVQVSYDPDIFGLNRLVTHSFKAREDQQRYALQEAYLTLEGNTVTTAIEVASLNAQVKTTRMLIGGEMNILKIVKQQYHLGAVTYLDVVNQESQVAATQATLPPLEQSLAAARHALAVLLGRIPSQARIPNLNLNQLKLPVTLPVTLPSSLVHQRPDILSAEAQLRAGNAQVGEAIAKMYPLIQITGDLGFENGRLANFFDASSLIWSVAGSLTQTIFDGGTLRANKRAAEAALQAVVADYQGTILNDFAQVANALRAVQHDAQTLQYDQRAYFAAVNAYKLARWEYKA
ncbi:MAG: efflux transporter outer membrane subunit, partial [Phycisphaerae bacterium]